MCRRDPSAACEAEVFACRHSVFVSRCWTVPYTGESTIAWEVSQQTTPRWMKELHKLLQVVLMHTTRVGSVSARVCRLTPRQDATRMARSSQSKQVSSSKTSSLSAIIRLVMPRKESWKAMEACVRAPRRGRCLFSAMVSCVSLRKVTPAL